MQNPAIHHRADQLNEHELSAFINLRAIIGKNPSGTAFNLVLPLERFHADSPDLDSTGPKNFCNRQV
jgi:hypothetical protein